jgi:hypothetical protein
MTTSSCTDTSNGQIYYYLGPFVANNYAYKAFTGMGTAHFQVDVYWSYGILGTWTGQQLSAIFTDGNGAVTQLPNQGQTCAAPAAFTGCIIATGCFLNNHLTISHYTDFLSANFSSMGSAISSSSSVQSWGVKDFLIVVSNCFSTCLTCYGPNATNCLTCPTGLYLSGSVCILSCPYYTVPGSNLCVTACPQNYYVNTLNAFC